MGATSEERSECDAIRKEEVRTALGKRKSRKVTQLGGVAPEFYN